MKNKYTPSPWQVINDVDNIYIGDKYQNAIQLHIVSNARLISQAPAMYELLKRMLNEPDYDELQIVNEITNIIKQVEG